MQRMMQIRGVVLGLIAWTGFAFSLTSLAAVSLQPALQSCQQRVEQDLPETTVELTPGSELPSGTVVIQWQAAEINGYCRVAVEDGTIVEFVNPYAVPVGQRPIENIAAFQTEAYTVRVVRLAAQLYMNVYNRRSDRIELNRELVQAVNSEEGMTYTNLLGQRRYRAIVAPDGSYRLVISLGSRLVVYDREGVTLENPASARMLVP